MEISELYTLFLNSKGVTTDSRTISGGEIFFALKGENFDGNLYAAKALEAGAAYAVVDSGSCYCGTDERILDFPDTLAALKQLARYHRDHTLVDGKRITVIGLTGTNGKTTTKELIREVLSCKYRVTATKGNLNNDIGVPLSLLQIDDKSQIAVIEMGANHPDDIEKLVSVADPDYGLITNVGKAHLLGFGSFDGVKAAKGALYDHIKEYGKAVFINADDSNLKDMAQSRGGLSLIPYGLDCWNCLLLPSDENHPYLRIAVPSGKTEGDMDELIPIETSLVGTYNAPNVLAAVAVGLHFGISLEDAASAISAYVPSNNRSQMQKSGTNSLIIDAYNANPTSMAAALDNFAAVSSQKKVALLGDMRELGNDSLNEHREIVRRISQIPMDLVCLVGEEFKKAAELEAKADNIICFEDSEQLGDYLEQNKLENALVLIKGSRGVKMENALKHIC